jgi:hypothetical protein
MGTPQAADSSTHAIFLPMFRRLTPRQVGCVILEGFSCESNDSSLLSSSGESTEKSCTRFSLPASFSSETQLGVQLSINFCVSPMSCSNGTDAKCLLYLRWIFIAIRRAVLSS